MANSLTNEGAINFEHSMNFAIEYFSKSGSLFSTKTKQPFYNNGASALELFKPIWISGQKELAMKLLFHTRDCRGGSGNRSAFKEIIKWLVETDPKWVEVNIGLIPEHGRWDDLRILFDTHLDNQVAKLWADAILNKNVLAAKWADRSDKSLLRYLRKIGTLKDIGEFRKLLARVRKEHIVEHKMCSKNWNEIEYPKIPSVAMSRYSKAFGSHDAVRFSKFKEKVESGEVKINASVAFPHDLVRILKDGDTKIADLQFNALPNYMEDSNERIMTLVDSSGSMCSIVGGTVRAFDVSTSLGLYCSDRLAKDNPFYRKFMEFESENKLSSWEGMSFSECYVGPKRIFNEACGSTNVEKALLSILNHAKMFNATKDQVPSVLLIISDMQFDQAARDSEDTVVNACMRMWEDAGYNRPRIVYWNVAGCSGSPELSSCKDVGLVSGFSPAILGSIFGGKDFSPIGIMTRAIEKYKVVCPQ